MSKVGVVLKFKINRLAWLFYRMHGYNVEIGYDFSKSKHPQEKLMFEMAKTAIQFCEQKDT